MSGYVDLDTLKENVYFVTATLDERFVWEKIPPAEDQWHDGMDRYRITGCAHPPAYRDGALCTHCGHADEPVRKGRKK